MKKCIVSIIIEIGDDKEVINLFFDGVEEAVSYANFVKNLEYVLKVDIFEHLYNLK